MKAPEDDRTGVTADEVNALAALKRAEPPAVPAEVRERIRRAFLTGEAASSPVHRSSSMPRARSGQRWGRAAGMAAALVAVAAVAVLVRAGLQPAGSWRVTEVAGPRGIKLPAGPVAPAGVPVPGTIVGRGPIRVGASSELELGLDSRLRLRLLPGTEAALPAAPARWLGRTRTLEVRAGEVFGATRGPLGFRLRLSTPEAEAVLSGTSFAVIRNHEATCFCLYRGRLDITERRQGRPLQLPGEHRVLIYRDGRPPRVEPITDRERMKLSMMDAAGPPPVLPR